MKILGDVVIRFFDLLEAEGRALKENAARLALLAALFLIATVLAVAGFGLVLAGAHILLTRFYGSAMASFVVGGLSIAASAAFFYGGYRYIVPPSRGKGGEKNAGSEDAGTAPLGGGGQAQPTAFAGGGESGAPGGEISP